VLHGVAVSMLQLGAVCCGDMLQRVAVSVLQGVAERCSVCCSSYVCAAVCCSVCCSELQCVCKSRRRLFIIRPAECSVAAWCSVLPRAAVCCVAVCCSVLQCVAVCCSVLQCVAMCCSVLHFVCVLSFKRIFIIRPVEHAVLQRLTVCCSVLQRVAVCCSECVAVCVAVNCVDLNYTAR